jgi:WD40 repeat protein
MTADDPARVFADRLRRLQTDSGGPSVRDLVRLTDKVGSPYSRGTIQDKLAGRSPASWEFVEAFVRACNLHAGSGTPPDLRPWRGWHTLMTREVAARRRRAAPVDVCPYRGLEAFTAEQAAWFQGRSAAVQQVLTGLDTHRAGIVVLGPSGAGKSSLVQAGVLPALAAGALPGSDQWIPLPVRPYKDLPAELNRAGLPVTGDRPIDAVVPERLAGEPAGTRLLLVIDQFEEMLTPVSAGDSQAAQQQSLADLAAAIGTPGLSLLLVMRDDFYPRLASQAPELLQALMPGLLNVPATLNAQDLRDIITLPALDVGLTLQDGLAERIVTDALATDPGRLAPVTVLPLLELTLQQLWQRRQNRVLTHEAYQRVGGITGALTSWCGAAIEQLPADQRAVARRILTALVRPADVEHHIPAVRQQVPVTALRRLAAASDAAFDEVLADLTDHRIVSTRNARGVPVAELVHEAMIREWPDLRDWVIDDHRFQDWLRRAEDRHTHWVGRQDTDDLLHGGELAEGADWAARRQLPEHIAEFLAASRHHQRAGVRRTRTLAAVLAALLAVALAATGVALRQRQTAINAERVALSRQLAAQSTALLGVNSDLASLLAAHAYRISPTVEAITSLYTAAATPLKLRLDSETQWTLALSPDRKTLATGALDGTIRLRELPGGRLRTALTGHQGTVHKLAFTGDGRTLASAGQDHTVRLWHLTGRHPPTVLKGHTDEVTLVFLSPDGRTLISAGNDHTVRVWDAGSGRHRATIDDYLPETASVALSPDGNTLAVGSTGGTVRLWDVPSRRTLTMLRGHEGNVQAVAFSKDGRRLATGDNRTARLWSVPDGRPQGVLSAHTDEVRAVAFSPDGRTLATGSNDHTAKLWNLTDRRPRATLTGATDDVNDVQFSPDGRALLTTGNDGVARLWRVDDGQLRVVLSGAVVNLMAFTADGSTIATVGPDGARLWDGTAGLPLRDLTDGTGNLWLLAYAPDGRTIATAGDDPAIRLWDPDTGRIIDRIPSGGDRVWSLAYSPDGQTLAAGIDDQVVLVDRNRRYTYFHLRGSVSSVVFSRDGRTLAAGNEAGTILLVDLTDGNRQRSLTGHAADVYSLAFSPDGRTLASAGRDRTIRLWDRASGRAGPVLRGHNFEVETVTFSPDGRTIVSGSREGARMWDVATGRLQATLAGQHQRVIAVAFSPDGRTLATASADSTVRLWDVAGVYVHTVIGGFIDSVNAVAFSPDGRTLATAGWRDPPRLWRIAVPSPDTAIEKICRSVGRDLTPEERTEATTPVCP